MGRTLRVTLVANAGLLLEYDGTTLLLDGIYGREGHPFSNLPDKAWQRMLNAEHPFEKIDYLLFTHAHPDHFSPEMTLEFLERRRVKGVFLPDTRSVRESGLIERLTQSGTPAVPLSGTTDHASYQIEPEISVHAFLTPHLDKKFAHVKHFCYLLTFGEKRLLITADADYVHEDFACLGDTRLRAVFVNPLFFSALRTGRFFHGSLNAETVCVYHIPFREDDATGMRGRLAHAYALWGTERPDALLLSEPFERLTL